MPMSRRRITVMFFLVGLVVGGAVVAGHMVWKAMLRAAHAPGVSLPGQRTAVAFRADSTFTQDEQILILEAAKAIDLASGGCVHPSVVFEPIRFSEATSWREDGRATIYRAASWHEWAHHLAKKLAEPDHCVGISFTCTGDIFVMISRRAGKVDFRNTVIHEMLHVVFKNGWHSTDKDSLMYHSIGGNRQKMLGVETNRLRAMCPR